MELSQQEFEALRLSIHKICGILVTMDKQYLIKSRLEPVAKTHGYTSFAQLHGKMSYGENRHLIEDVIEAITTNETSFFRDSHPFKTFKEFIMPKLSEFVHVRKRRGSKVRIWCAASSTGQEPYTLAMLIDEYVKSNKWKKVAAEDFNIVATDISSAVLAQALRGEFSNMEVKRGLPDSYRQRYFREEEGRWYVNDDLKQMIDFKRLNLMDSFSFLGGIDIIFCRNVLIYFDEDKKRDILKRFYQSLNDGCFLFLGSTESLYGLNEEFTSKQHGETILYCKA